MHHYKGQCVGHHCHVPLQRSVCRSSLSCTTTKVSVSLPTDLKLSSSLSSFKSRLKTLLFKKSYSLCWDNCYRCYWSYHNDKNYIDVVRSWLLILSLLLLLLLSLPLYLLCFLIYRWIHLFTSSCLFFFFFTIVLFIYFCCCYCVCVYVCVCVCACVHARAHVSLALFVYICIYEPVSKGEL